MSELIRNMPASEYHSTRRVSKSGLDKIARSPAHYVAAIKSPSRCKRLPIVQRLGNSQERLRACSKSIDKDSTLPKPIGSIERADCTSMTNQASGLP